MIKTGQQHIESLRDGRQVFINGGLAGDVTEHLAFKNSVASVGELYDFQSRPDNKEVMTFQTNSGHSANRIWQLPTSYDDLVERRKGLEAWTKLHAGFLGRSPDHVASCISGMRMGLEVFEENNPQFANNLLNYYEHARDNDTYLTYVIINPQADRSKSASEQASEFIGAGVADQDGEGITLRGGKMLATGGIMANEVLVTQLVPLREGEEKYAFSCVVPMNAPGLKILSRKSYEQAADNRFDNPFSSRFDENDAVLYFDDVKVPWERVFVHNDVAMAQKQFHATPAHVYQNYQAQIRLSVKLKFLTGVAYRLAETNGVINFPQVREKLGQLAADATMIDSNVHAMEAKGYYRNGYFLPDRHTLYASQTIAQQLYGNFLNTIRDLAGGGVIMLPSHVTDYNDPELAKYIDATQQSPICSSRERVKFMKLAWDVVGSEFASRHAHYEMFYSGASFVVKGHSFRTYDWAQATDMVDYFLDQIDLDDTLAGITSVAAE
jgi:4-hydroxyphenylacetate 3-monooxygenase